jgi:cytoskeletal protein CcmA (bactofilin family)
VLIRGRGVPIDKIETVIGPNTNFKGTLISDGSVRIDGICEEGFIKTVGNIVVGPEAKVAADLEGENVSVSGSVTGNITALGRLEILSTGKVWGDASVGSFMLDDDGGFFKGQLSLANEPDQPTFAPVPAAPESAQEAPLPVSTSVDGGNPSPDAEPEETPPVSSTG